MPTLEMVDLNNAPAGSIELSDAVFAAEVNQALLYEAVRHYTAAGRSGTAKTKTRHEVSGSGKKLWKQKGTGRARMGSIRSPLWRHGGTVHGPQPRSYEYKLPKKMILGAMRSALSAKLRDGELKVIKAFELADHKTKNMAGALARLDASRSALIVEAHENSNLIRASRNLPGVKLVGARDVNVYDLLKYRHVLLSEAAAKKLSEGLAK